MEESDQSSLTQGVAKVDNILDKYKFPQGPQFTDAKQTEKSKVCNEELYKELVQNKSGKILSENPKVAPKERLKSLILYRLKRLKCRLLRKTLPAILKLQI